MRRPYFYAILVVLFWATVASAFKISLRFLNFIQLLFWSSLFSAILLFIIVLAQRKMPDLIESYKNFWKNSLISGFLNPFLYYFILFKAYSLLLAQEAQPLNQTWAIILAILSAILLKQPLYPKSIIALCISFFGVLIITTHLEFRNLKFSNPLGVILALGSAFVWSIYWIYNLKDQRDVIVKLLTNFTFGLLFILPVIFLTKNFSIPDLSGILCGIYVGTFEMGITFVLWLKALKLAPVAARITNLIYLVPFFSLIIIGLVLKERIQIWTILGLIFIITGIIIQTK